jgi:hypothetical protein
MADGSERTIDRIQTFVPVEQSMSIDPHLDREKQQDPRRRKRSQTPRTVQEQLDEEEAIRENKDSEHVDYHA